MISYLDALKLTSTPSPIQEIEKAPLLSTQNRVLSEDIVAPCPLPLFDNSAMDGFAIRMGQVNQPIHVAGTRYAAALNDPFDSPTTSAIRIMTGAPVPGWADLVVPVEDIEYVSNEDGDEIIKLKAKPYRESQHIRRKGEDYQQGENVFSKHHRLTSNSLMILASFGIQDLSVFMNPSIWLSSTGSEVIQLGTPLKPGEIYNSSQIYLQAELEKLNLNINTKHHLPDDISSTTDFLKSWTQAKGPTLLITTGAVSKGDKDFLPQVAKNLGLSIHFHRCAIRPGKPIMFSSFDQDHYWFAAPGNIISTTVAWMFFMRPFLNTWAHLPPPQRVQTVLAEDRKKPLGLRAFFRGLYDGKSATMSSEQGSQRVKPTAESNVIVELPEDTELVKKGSPVHCTFL